MKKTILIATTFAVALAAVSVPALAKRRPAAVAAIKTIQKVDTDASRTISAPEFSAAGGNDATFALIDANANGQLGFFELIRAFFARAMAQRAQ